jgi:isopentenyl-diphosphate delta-isomerase
MWANTCCTHPHWGEDVASSAHRRLKEEIGISLDLSEVGQVIYLADVGSGLTEHEHVHVFRADVASMNLPLDPDPAEVSATRWADRNTLRAQSKGNPDAFAPWFRIYLERWPELGL